MIVALIACSATKKPKGYWLARDLYTGDLFQKSLAYAEKVLKAKRIYVLSAKYFLVDLYRRLDPYDVKLGKGPKNREWWSRNVLADLRMVGLLDDEHTWHLLAGHDYIEFIAPLLPGRVVTPLAGMGIGEQLAWLKEQLDGSK